MAPPAFGRDVVQKRFEGRLYLVLGRADAPSVLLLHELAGIDEHLLSWARRLGTRFRVVVPALLDPDGDAGALATLRAICISREIHFFAAGRTSPIVDWLRRLVAHDVPGRYGVIGMCMTGGFALAVAVDERVSAAVVAQPALPVSTRHLRWIPGDGHRVADLGLDRADLERLRDRADLRVRAFRFRDDAVSPPERLRTAHDLLGDRIQTRELTEPSPTNHSTLTTDEAAPAAVEEVMDFLVARLAPP